LRASPLRNPPKWIKWGQILNRFCPEAVQNDRLPSEKAHFSFSVWAKSGFSAIPGKMPRASANGGKAAAEEDDNGGEDMQEDDAPDMHQPALQLGASLFPLVVAGPCAGEFFWGSWSVKGPPQIF
jgi:hypothetical protein